MFIYSNNHSHVKHRNGVTFEIIPKDREMTSQSLTEGQDKLMGINFPEEDYFIKLKVYTAMNHDEWQFAKTTLITFEGMIKKKLNKDRKYYHEAPAIYLIFESSKTEPSEVYERRLTEIRHLLMDYLNLENGLRYWIDNSACPTIWAIEFVKRGIVNKGNYRLD